MSSMPDQSFSLNGATYHRSQLSPEGCQLLDLLTEARAELGRLDVRKSLIQAAEQQLIQQIKCLVESIPNQPPKVLSVLGAASQTIPTSDVVRPEEQPAPIPKAIPLEFSNENSVASHPSKE